MADFKLVGAVAIKVRPDASGFRSSTDKQVKKELAGYEAEVDVTANVDADTTEMKTDVEKAKKEIERKKMTLRVNLDYDSVKKAQAQLEAAVKGLNAQKIKVTLDEEGIERARQELDDMKADSDIEMTFVPDEKGYKAVLAKIAEIRRQKLEETIHFGWSEEELAAKEAEMKAALQDSLTMQIHYGNDRASIERMLAQVNGELDKLKEITFESKVDKKSLKTTREFLKNALARTPVELKVNYNDQDSLKAVRDRLKTMLSELKSVPLKVGFNEEELQAEIARINSMIDVEVGSAVHDTTVKISYNSNRASVEKAIAEINAELDKIDAVKAEVALDKPQLLAKRAELQAILAGLPVEIKINYDDQASLKAARERLRTMLNDVTAKTLEVKLDEAEIRAEIAKLNLLIKEEVKDPKIKPGLSTSDYIKTLAALKILTRNQTVTIFTKVHNSSLLLAAAKLTGLRAASRWTEEFARALGTLDRNLPIVAAAVIGISTLASGVLSLTANIFSLGNGLGEVIRMGGLLAPTMILGLSSVLIVLKAVFKDFGAAAHGITAAMKRLPASGQEAARTFQKVFAEVREQLSSEFWDKASDGMLRFSKTALPAFGAGLVKLSGSLGGIFSNILDSFTNLTKQGGIKLFFDNMSHGFDLAQTGLADFMDAFNTLAVIGSTAFPRMGRAFNEFADKFNAWVQRLSADGTLARWIDIGIQGMKDLFSIGSDLVKVWGNIGQAAQAAGALTLTSFAAMMGRLDTITSGNRFQANMKAIFQGARQASDSFHKALGDLGPAMDVFSQTVKTTLSGAGKALGAFIADIGDVLASPKVAVGLTAFLTGIQTMFESLRPAANDVATILMTLGQILGQVATDSGPLFRNLFEQIATVLTIAWDALEPFLPRLINIGSAIVGILGPALGSAANDLIPAFANAVIKLGEGLLPVINFLSLFAAGVAQMLSGFQVPTLVLMAGIVLSLGTSFKVAAIAVPILTGALKLLNVQIGLTAMSTSLAVPVVGILLAALTGLALGGIAALATSQSSATPFADQYADALQRDAEAAGAVAGAVGEATTATALNNLVKSGAYDLAQKLGISQETLTDALLKGGSAQDEVNQKMREAKDAYIGARDGAMANALAGARLGSSALDSAEATKENYDAQEKLGKILGENKGSLDLGIHQTKQLAEVNKQAGLKTGETTVAQKGLAEQAGKTGQALGAAAAASRVLTDTFSSSAAKVDAMRKTLAILVPANTKQQVAESLGAYVQGLNNIRDTAVSLAPTMKKLGDSIYGNDGFLNVSTGNKAVMQLNQALVDEVNNVWSGAKTAYDAAITQGKTAKVAFAEAQDFVKKHKGDYDQLATDSGLASEKVQGQWKAVFGEEWVLKVSLEGATEAAATAQALLTSVGANFDGKRFQAFLDANPDAALKAVTDAGGAATDFVNSEWEAKLKATPKQAQDSIAALLDKTGKEWVRGDFTSILKVAKEVPGLAEAILKIMTGANADYEAIIFAQVNGYSLQFARDQLNQIAARRTAIIDVIVKRSALPDLNGDVSGSGRYGSIANGGIFRARQVADLFKGQFKAGVNYFANGGIERHVAQITRAGGPIRVWSEPETQGEAYVPYAMSKRPRSVAILSQVAKDFGYTLNRRGQSFAGGGTTGVSSVPTSTTSTSVTVGTINTVDPEAAIQKLRTLQRDALAVAGII